MSRRPAPRPLLLLAALILAASAAPSQETARVSSFGKYSGYSQAVYDGWERSGMEPGWPWTSSGRPRGRRLRSQAPWR